MQLTRPHGWRSTYEAGCRCPDCRAAWRRRRPGIDVKPLRWPPSKVLPRRGAARPFRLDELERSMRATTTREVAGVLDVCRRTVQRLRVRGLTVDEADHYALRAGFHPAEVWSAWSSDR